MIVGAGVAVFWEVAGLVDTTELAPMVTGVVSSTVTMIVVTLVTQKIAPVPAYIHEVMDEAATVGRIPPRFLAATNSDLTNEAVAVDAALSKGGQNNE
jgi:hypothetical protein